MKGLYCFKLKPLVLRSVLSPVRDRLDVSNYILNLAKLALITECFEREEPETDDTVIVHIGGRARAYVKQDSKIVSVAFPFLLEVGSDTNFVTLSGIDGGAVSSRTISQLQGMLGTLRESGFGGFTDYALALDFAEDGRSELDEDVWPMFKALLFLDDGYLRYDHDTVRANGSLHPEHHIDAFYSNRASVKLGLYAGISVVEFQAIINAAPGCHYLKSFEV